MLSALSTGAAVARDPLRAGPSVRTGLIAWHRLGSSLARARRNLAEVGLPPASVFGAPVVTTSVAVDGDVAYLFEPLAETADATIIFAARSADTQASSSTRLAIGGWGIDEGLSLFCGGATTLRAQARFNVAGTPTNRTATLAVAAGFAAWRLYAGVVKAGTGVTVYNLTDGTSAATADTISARILAATPTFRMGSSLGGVIGFGDLAFAAVYAAALTQPQLAQLRTRDIAPLLAIDSIVV